MDRLVIRSDGTKTLLELLKDPFNQKTGNDAVLAGLITSISFTLLLAVGFSFLRPYNSIVYAPKLKVADEKHAPPALGRGVLAWLGPVLKTNEQDLIQLVGLDATIFLRFQCLLRNLFLALTLIGCGILVPVNLINGKKSKGLYKITPLNTFGRSNWATVAVAWLVVFTMMGILYWEYRAVLRLRRQYYDSMEYKTSLHARTLMLNDVPTTHRSNEGIAMLIDQVAQTSSFSLTAIARNVRDLPDLIEQHGQAVRGLEKILAKYLQNPDALPPQRPMCKPSKKDPSHASYPRGTKVDAIDYMTKRIHDLEILIKEVRASVDNRNPLPYGFATFEAIDEAHSIAYAARKKAVKGSTIRLAPRPNDIIWKNMHLTPGQRRTRRFINSFWMLLLTLLYAAPNAMIAIFLVQLANLGAVWPAFHRSLSRNTTWWAIVQGVASPAITSLVYLILPPIFRRLSMRAGDRTKTARDRHVAGKLYTFFVFNYLLVFSIFSTAWSFAANVIESTNDGEDAWKAILDADFGMGLFISLCNISPFWITWLLQRNLGAAVDLAQLWQLFWSFCVRKMSNPTPREMIELTAPPAFDYAAYYNFCLFYSTVALCFTVLQPLVLPAAALYFALDVYLKKYLLLYIFITKTESGGMFWRMLFNRLIFATILMTLVVFMSAWVHGDGGHVEAYTVVPLPVILLAFKFYCRRVFDDKIHYVTTNMLGSDEAAAKMSGNRVDKLSKKFGHPALYKPLITPMVHAKAQHKLASIYAGRLSDSNADSDDINSISGYSDTLALDQMMPGQVGRPSKGLPKFEMVPENRLDFAFYKSRAEFRDEHGGHGGIYGRAEDIDRPDTPGSGTTWVGTDSRPSTPSNHGVLPPDWKALPTVPISHDASGDVGYAGRSNLYMHDNDSQAGLMRHAYQPGYSPPGHEYATYNPSAYHAYTPSMGTPGTTTPAMRDPYGQQQAPGILGGGPRGYGELPQHGEDDASPQSYFRGGASTGRRNQSSRDDTPDDRSNQF